MPREFARHQRLGNQLLRTLAELLRFEVEDPRLAEVSLTSVALSRDLGTARVCFSLLHPDDDTQDAQAGLLCACGFLRRRLGQKLRLRRVPELRFTHDDSAAEGVRIMNLIQQTTDRHE